MPTDLTNYADYREAFKRTCEHYRRKPFEVKRQIGKQLELMLEVTPFARSKPIQCQLATGFLYAEVDTQQQAVRTERFCARFAAQALLVAHASKCFESLKQWKKLGKPEIPDCFIRLTTVNYDLRELQTISMYYAELAQFCK